MLVTRWRRAAWAASFALVASLATGATADPVTAAAATGRIEGTVTAEDTGQPLGGVCVQFYGAPPSDVVPKGPAVRTRADGTYAAAVPIGPTLVVSEAGYFCVSEQDDYVGEVFDDATEIAEATPVDVQSGRTHRGIDMELARPSHITGAVTADAGGAPVEGICVYAGGGTGFDWGGGATTGPDGVYGIGGLTAGHLEVQFRDCTPPIDFVAETYDDVVSGQSGTVVPVGVAATVGNVDASLATAGHITGRVTDDSTQEPAAGVSVHARWQAPPGPYRTMSADTLTAADGTYDIGGLPEGTYAVTFSTNDGRFARETYDDVVSGQGYQPVVVQAAAVVTGIDAALRPACGGTAATVDLRLEQVPTNGSDVIRGTSGDDVIAALQGDDRVCAMAGDDLVIGGAGFDRLEGQGGADELRGGLLRDHLAGGNGPDRLHGGRGRDVLVGDAGLDDCSGGDGTDSAFSCEHQSDIP